MRSILFLALIALAFSACDPTYTPKPTGYPRIDMPAHKYQEFKGDCPFTFRYPVYAEITRDSSAGAEPCWFQIYFPQFNANIHMSYKNVTSSDNFLELVNDAEGFANKHSAKAEDIYDSVFYYPGQTAGVMPPILRSISSAALYISIAALIRIPRLLLLSLYGRISIRC